jgi:hypothetical protein
VVSLVTPPPKPEQVTRDLAFQWGDLQIFTDLGSPWYRSILTWWLLAMASMITLYITFSGWFF